MSEWKGVGKWQGYDSDGEALRGDSWKNHSWEDDDEAMIPVITSGKAGVPRVTQEDDAEEEDEDEEEPYEDDDGEDDYNSQASQDDNSQGYSQRYRTDSEAESDDDDDDDLSSYINSLSVDEQRVERHRRTQVTDQRDLFTPYSTNARDRRERN
jgi:hypothetical protein